ncbi:MAG TPA: TlpA disulfide reductase family protein [Gemmatimonadota bacterium]|nr:TlpA disulfide reductase family protein [Gemmatimonadota bacterium]
MSRSVRLRTLALVAGFATCLAACDRPGEDGDPAAEAIGEPRRRPAPDFALETLEGDSLHQVDLAEYDVVLMNFWASWCAPCKVEIPDLMEIHQEYVEEGFTVLGVVVNDLPRDARAFAEEIGIVYPSVIGTPEMLEDYGISPWLPTTLLVVDGEIVREWVGPRTRKEFDYAVRVGLGKAPPLADVLADPPGGGDPDGR